jgi:hypothetical protein
MGSRGSSSESTTSSQQQNYDQRVAAESGIAVGAGGTYIQTFDKDVGEVISNLVNKVFDFSSGVVNKAGTIIENVSTKSVEESSQQASEVISSNRQLTQNQQLGTSSLLSELVPVMVIGAIGITVFLVIGGLKGR